MAAFMAAFSHFCNNSTRGALPRVVVYAQPHLFCASDGCMIVPAYFAKLLPILDTNCQEVLYFSVIEQKKCCTA